MIGVRSIAGGVIFVTLMTGCSGAAPPETVEAPRSSNADYLLGPLLDYPFGVSGEVADRLDEAYGYLLEGELEQVRRTAQELVLRDPFLHPALLLEAQVELERGQLSAAVARLEPVASSLPEYTAAQMTLARAAERLGDLVIAYEAYSKAASRNALAARRSLELRERAVQILGFRVSDEVSRGRLETAVEHLMVLQSWAPESEATYLARLQVAEAAGDPEEALEAARGLEALRPSDSELRERRAALEVQAGDPRVGMSIFRELAKQDPEDEELADLVAWAEFRWRIEMMPAEVRELVRQPELSRADTAVLIYWLFPEVRYGQVAGARIATDVLEHPERERIVRVVNLGLMKVDPNLHLFVPERSLTRLELIESLLEILRRVDPPLTCVAALELNVRPSTEALCGAAAACRLIPEIDDCLPLASISGGEAVEWIRRTQEALESR